MISINAPLLALKKASIDQIAQYKGILPTKDGVSWYQLKTGFWWPLDITTPLSYGVKPASILTWGYQHVVEPYQANSIITFMLIEHLNDYGAASLNNNVRKAIRRGLEALEIRLIDTYRENEAVDAMLCWNDLQTRTHWRSQMSQESFLAYWRSLIETPGHPLIGAFHSDRLVGWLVGNFFANNSVYISRYASQQDFFSLRVNNTMIYTFLVSAQAAGGQIANFALAIPDRPSLDKFKENMGFKKTALPAFTFIHPLLKPLLTIFFRKSINRITGWS